MLRNKKYLTEIIEIFYRDGDISGLKFAETHDAIAKNTIYSQIRLVKSIDAILSEYLKDREIKKDIQLKIASLL
ncbi:MAG: hypothetical protein QXU98_12955 [Candidatus Parvarchaeota archaeon]